MSQVVTLAADLVIRLGSELGGNSISIPSGTVLTFTEATSLDAAAEMMAGISRAALAANIAQFNREDSVSGEAQQVTHGPSGEKISTGQGTTPVLVSATIEDAADTIIVATFDKDLNSVGDAYATGFSCKVATVARVINSAARQADNAVVHFTLASAVTAGQAVELSYNNATGNLESDTGGELQSFTDTAVTNNVVA